MLSKKVRAYKQNKHALAKAIAEGDEIAVKELRKERRSLQESIGNFSSGGVLTALLSVLSLCRGWRGGTIDVLRS